MNERIAKIPMEEYLNFLKVVNDLEVKGFTSVNIPNAFSYVKDRSKKYYSDGMRSDLNFYTNLNYSSSFFTNKEFGSIDDIINHVEEKLSNASKANEALQNQVKEFILEMNSESWKSAYEELKSKMSDANNEIKRLKKYNKGLKEALNKRKSKKRWWQI